MNEYVQLFVTAMAVGLGTGIGMAIGTYFANKGFIRSLEKLADAVKNGGSRKQ